MQSNIKVYKPKDLLELKESKKSYIVENLLAEGNVSLLFGRPKIGKTTVAKQAGLCVSKGTEFLGRKTRKCNVLYAALEESPTEFTKPLKLQGLDEDDSLAVIFELSGSQKLEQIENYIQENNISLLFLDTFFHIQTQLSDINDYLNVYKAFEPIVRLARKNNIHIMVIHHAKKGDSVGVDSALGSTAITAAVDTIIILDKKGDHTTIYAKQRYGEDLEKTSLNFDKETSSFYLGEKVSTQYNSNLKKSIIDFLCSNETKITFKKIEESVHGRTISIKSALNELVQEEKVLQSGTGLRNNPYLYSIPNSPSKERKWD